MKSLYGQYLEEREDMGIVENDYGFATFKMNQEECYIRDLYVVPEARKKHIASALADQIVELAKENGCKYLTGTVCPAAKNSNESIKVLMAYGMSLHSASQNLIIFKKDIH